MRYMSLSAVLVLGAATAFAQTVTVQLASPQNGQTIAGGSSVNWTISFSVSSGDNDGLALLSADLVQDAKNNPATLNIPYANAVPSGMTNFARPAGIDNPPEGGNTTGYVGSQRGESGAMNLVQIGGGQNTFGAVPSGGAVGQNANAVGGVGQSGSQILASGSFAAPATDGVYSFSLDNIVANVIDTLNASPAFSPVVSASVDASSTTITFTVSGGGCPAVCADSNCDGAVTVSDIGFFVTAVAQGEAAWNAAFPGGTAPCAFCANDTNGDGFVTVSDIGPFVTAVTGGGCQ
ncbi:MAG: hypothetical protein AB7N71_02795 [Phycisphaerae bacterium]